MRLHHEDPSTCLVCRVSLPSRWERANPKGRPRSYCSERCKSTAYRHADMTRNADRLEAAGNVKAATTVRASVASRLADLRAEDAA